MSTVRVQRSQCPLSERVVESDSEQSGLSGAGQMVPPLDGAPDPDHRRPG